jgi:hypothetical protein
MFTIVATIVQQITTELNGTEPKEDRIMTITKIVLKLTKQIVARVHMPVRISAFNANGITRQRNELNKQ